MRTDTAVVARASRDALLHARRAESSRAEPSRAEPSRAEPSRAAQTAATAATAAGSKRIMLDKPREDATAGPVPVGDRLHAEYAAKLRRLHECRREKLVSPRGPPFPARPPLVPPARPPARPP